MQESDWLESHAHHRIGNEHSSAEADLALMQLLCLLSDRVKISPEEICIEAFEIHGFAFAAHRHFTSSFFQD